jgi:anthranilate synthase component I
LFAGKLKHELDAWDALRATLPVGTISGAPKVRAMQIIDELEENRRGPYGGGFGHVSFTGAMDIALALRTMVIPSDATDSLFHYKNRFKKSIWNKGARRQWDVHIQAGAGLVADSEPESEFQECVNKANAMSRAIDVAEHVFRDNPEQ